MRKHIIEMAYPRREPADRTVSRGDGHHPGLLLDRFFATKNPRQLAEVDGAKLGEHKRELHELAILSGKQAPLCNLYRLACKRWCDELGSLEGLQSEILTTAGQSRVIVGLGIDNVLEVGLRLHHNYGVPVIPGSALKGLAAHYCHSIWGQAEDPNASAEAIKFRRGEATHSLLFGTTEDGGILTFHDAWLTPDSLEAGALKLDVITPHHPDWQNNNAPPTDFDSPKPVSFLSVSGAFQVALSWSGPRDANDEAKREWTGLAMELLRDALEHWGIGGKTSSGYGRLHGKVLKSWTEFRAGQLAKAEVIPNPKKNDAIWARHVDTELEGAVQNWKEVANLLRVGDVVEFFIANLNERQMTFCYPTDAMTKKYEKTAKEKSAGASKTGGNGGRGRWLK